MRNSIVRRESSQPPKRAARYGASADLGSLPLSARRCIAYAAEVTLIAASALIPLQLAAVVGDRGASTALLPPRLEQADVGTAPLPQPPQPAPFAPLWWLGVLLPAAVGGWQILRLSRTGQTPAKSWFAVQVMTGGGLPPTLKQAIVRQVAGRWGLPLVAAYAVLGGGGAWLGAAALLGSTALLATEWWSLSNRQQRTFCDRLTGTYVLDAAPTARGTHLQAFDMLSIAPHTYPAEDYDWTDEDGAITAIVLTPAAAPHDRGAPWALPPFNTAMAVGGVAALVLILATAASTQVYVQRQITERERHQQKDQVFLALTQQMAAASAPRARRAAILALGTIEDARATLLLTDLFIQETDAALISSIEQALVSRGLESLPGLHRLNILTRTELASLRTQQQQVEYRTAALRQRATQRAINKLLRLYSGQAAAIHLNQIDLAQRENAPAPFTLALEQVNLAGIKLRGALLAGAQLKDSRWSDIGGDRRWGTRDDRITDLGGAELKNADLNRAELERVILAHANLANALLNKANLTAAQLDRANLSGASLIGANLQVANLQQASLTGADLSSANLSQADLRSAVLGQVRAAGVQLQAARLMQSDWRDADLLGANLQKADLTEADLSGARLAGADLENTQLQNAALRGADLSQTNLRGANLVGTDFKGARFVPPRPHQPGQFIQIDPDYQATDSLQGVDFSSARNLDPEQLRYICLQGGVHPRCQ